MSTARVVKPSPIASGNYFAQHGDPLEPANCMWCGRKLRAFRHLSNRPELADRRGDYGDNAFCGLRCGYAFGRRMAELGQALRPAS